MIKVPPNVVKAWRADGNNWVRDVFAGKIVLSNQQSAAFTEIGKICAAKIKAHKGKEELTREELRYVKYIGVDISSGMGSGKDFFASLLLFYWLMVWPVMDGQPPHGLATANTSKQLKNVLWRQAASIPPLSVKLYPDDPRSNTLLGELFTCQKEKIYRNEYNGNTYFFEAVTVSPNASSEEQAKSLTGRHAPFMLMILDEAAGLPEPVFTNLESTLSGMVNIILMIYNPIKSRGYAVEARKSDSWLSLNWNTEETVFNSPHLDNPIKARNADLLQRYGRDSNAYRIRVLGRPPLADTEVFIPWDWVQDAVYITDDKGNIVSGRDLTPAADDPIIMGVDPGAGGDNSSIAIRKGPVVLAIKRKNTAKPEDFLDWTIKNIREYKPDAVNIDTIGLGWGAIGGLRKLGHKNINAVDVRRTARNRDEYDLVRDELWGTFKDMFDKGAISIPNDQELIDQIGSIKVKDYDKRGRAKMPSKKDLRKNESVGRSPDDAEAICMTIAIPDNVIRKNAGHDEEDEAERRRKRSARRKGVSPISGY